MAHGRTGMTLSFMLGLVIATAATAGAASLITGKQIRNGTITEKDLSKGVRAQLRKAGVPGHPGVPGAKGDAGSRGEAGSKGEAGAVGPTEAVTATASHNPLLNPVASPDTPVDPEYGETTITTTKAGRLLISVTMPGAITCTSGLGNIGIYLDDAPVPGSNQPVLTSPRDLSLSGVTNGVVPTGSHKVTLAYDCPSGSASMFSYDTSHTTAIVLGG
jgi:hypothetical protein